MSLSLRVCSLAPLAALAMSLCAAGAAGQSLPEPPQPPRSAKVPPAEAVPAPTSGAPAAPLEGITYGSIVRGGVSAYPHVRVGDPHKVAPGAVPFFVAVRDPNCRKGPAGLVFVEVCLPTCPLCKVSVNRLGTKVELDYGKYEVDLIARNGVVIIDYDW